jgi:hypothetical protein
VLPDAGPLITLAYADARDLLLRPGWPVEVVDRVLHEVTRNSTPTSEKLAQWVSDRQLAMLPTRTFQHDQLAQSQSVRQGAPRKSHLGELAIQETMNGFALMEAPRIGVFLFEDHKTARTSFHVPDNCRKISTRSFLLFLEQKGWLDSAAAIERRAVLAGRDFSRLRFPPE